MSMERQYAKALSIIMIPISILQYESIDQPSTKNAGNKTLGSISGDWAKEVLLTALNSAEPDYVLNECQYSLDKMDKTVDK